MKTLIKHFIILYAILAISTPAMSQVTIGSTEDPTTGALLQIKQIEDVNYYEPNANGGLLLPRVELNPSDAEPMKPVINGAITEPEQKKHTGLVVYNMTTTQLAQQGGFTFWNGVQWNYVKAKVDDEVKKILYTNKEPILNNKIELDKMIFSLDLGNTGNPTDPSYYAIPQIMNNSGATQGYHWHYARFWDDGGTSGKTFGYSNDIVVTEPHNGPTDTSVGDGETKKLISKAMSPMARNEAWITNKTTGEIYHLHFFTMGQDNPSSNKIYGIIGEQF
ncbi:MAG: hypothetical protein LBS54_05215 [Dysgonamonadaceae bacterium]|jgi:hypothetical protein|nr:hypothetical protein [Dysgonamonadaceae bacterium]